MLIKTASIFMLFISLPALSDDNWAQGTEVQNYVSQKNDDSKTGVSGYARIYVDEESCKNLVLLNLRDVSGESFNFDTLIINGTWVRVNEFGTDALGITYYKAASIEGQAFILNEFGTKKEVTVKTSDMNALTIFSATGFSKALKAQTPIVKKCMEDRRSKANAL